MVRWALAALLLYVCFFSQLDALGLVGPDEPRYATIARGMAETGDWVTPRLDSKGWFEKPVLLYWTAGAAMWLRGGDETAARLPSALAALVTALALAYAGVRHYGAGAAWAVVLMFPTSVGVFAFARAATTDMLFSASLCLAMLAAAQMLAPWSNLREGPCCPILWLRIALGLFLGLAALAKGPAAILLAGGSVALWTLATQRWRDPLKFLHPVCMVCFAAVAAPWYALVALRNPEFVDVFFFSHNVQRFLTPVFRHEQPFWFFGPILLLGLLPWTVLLYPAASEGRRLWRENAWRQSSGFFFACWAAFPLLFFSLSKSKLPGYVLPSLPPLALLLAVSLARCMEARRTSGRWMLAAIGGTLAGLVLSAEYWLKRLPEETGFREPAHFLPALAAFAAAGALIALAALAGRQSAALVAAALLLGVLLECINRVVLPQLDAHLSPRTAAEVYQALPSQPAAPQVYQMHRAWHYGLNFYQRQELREWDPRSGQPAWIYASRQGLEEMEKRGVPHVVVSRIADRVSLVRVAGRPR